MQDQGYEIPVHERKKAKRHDQTSSDESNTATNQYP